MANPWSPQEGPLTHGHAVHVAFDDIEGVPQVPFRYVEDDVSLVGRVQRRDSPQEDDLCREASRGKGALLVPPQSTRGDEDLTQGTVLKATSLKLQTPSTERWRF